MTRIPALNCPECKSFKVHKNNADSIICEDCRKKFTTFGNTHKMDADFDWSKFDFKLRTEEEKAALKGDY